MIMVRLMGGLGNQMFQYAAGLNLASARSTRLKLDHSFLEDRTPRVNFMPREYSLHLVGVTEPRATPSEVRRFRQHLEPQPRNWVQKLRDRFQPVHFHMEPAPPTWQQDFSSLPSHTYLEGYFQDERYFGTCAGLLRQRFFQGLQSLPHDTEAAALAQEIAAQPSIALHIRRGDYINIGPTHAFHGVPSMAYYARGLANLREAGVSGPVYVFSDDVAWCRENLSALGELHFVSESLGGPSGTTHLYLMALCRHFVIANSTFAWWAAWLAEETVALPKKIIRPAAWFRAAEFRHVHPCPPSWIALDDEAAA